MLVNKHRGTAVIILAFIIPALATMAQADDHADAILCRVAESYDRLAELRANVSIDCRLKSQEPSRFSGHIKLARPNLARLDLIEHGSNAARKIVVVSDGTFVWEWRESDNHYTRTALNNGEGIPGRWESSMFLQLFYDRLSAVRSRYSRRDVRYLGKANVAGHLCEIVAIDEGIGMTLKHGDIIKLFLDDEMYAIKVEARDSLFEPGDTTTVTTFDYLDRNSRSQIDPADFVFEPPKGSRLVDDGFESVARSIDLNSKNVNGRVPLAEAVSRGSTNSVRILLGRGAKVDARSDDGLTPLMAAADAGNAEIIRLLLDHGAKTELEDTSGLTAFMHSLLSSDTSRQVPTAPNALQGSQAIVAKLLLNRCANVNSQDKFGRTPLMIAAKYGDLELLEPLIALGANINARDHDGFTALMQTTRADVARILLTHGAIVDTCGKANQTPLSLATRAGRTAVVRLLLEYGAKADARDSNGMTALDYAVRRRYTDIVGLLKESRSRTPLVEKDPEIKH